MMRQFERDTCEKEIHEPITIRKENKSTRYQDVNPYSQTEDLMVSIHQRGEMKYQDSRSHASRSRQSDASVELKSSNPNLVVQFLGSPKSGPDALWQNVGRRRHLKADAVGIPGSVFRTEARIVDVDRL